MNNHDVPLVVLFRSKFRGLFGGTSELGPQDVEEGVSVEGDITGKLEEFVLRICTLIGNRRKSVEYCSHPPKFVRVLIVDTINWRKCYKRLLIRVMRNSGFEGMGLMFLQW